MVCELYRNILTKCGGGKERESSELKQIYVRIVERHHSIPETKRLRKVILDRFCVILLNYKDEENILQGIFQEGKKTQNDFRM